jgi:radical SAM superfamily enzyme YgiQ (UPF0313 family)
VKEVSVYLADLRHNFSGVLANDCMPLGVAYMKAVMDRDLPAARSRVFAYPDRLLTVLEQDAPDVLMLSNYMWNESLSFHFAKLAKRVRPETLVVMGGPNIHLEADRQLDYFRDHPEIDVYVLGEGDFLGGEVVREFLEAGKSLARLGERELPSCLHRRPDGSVARTEMRDRERAIDDIPSPWLTGVLDEFFDGKLAPLLETNRGCPFQCTFCVQGVRWYTKVHYFSQERVRDEIEYIGRRIREVCPSMGFLRIADSNYGMFERDIEISTWIGDAQKRYGWPTYIDATTGKNRPERVIQSLEKANGAMVIYQAVQSLDDTTLKNIKRSNISKEAYQQVMIHVRGRGLRSLSDLILGLPGETLESHLAGIAELLDAGTNEMHLFQAMMLKGSELETAESRARYRFDTRFRILPRNYGVYGDEKVLDSEEIVVATDTLTFEDYLEARRYALTFGVFWNNSWFEDAAAFAAAFGVTPSQWVTHMRRAFEEDRGAVGRLLADFVAETRNELFPTREACVAFYGEPGNFERLMRGEIGDNLMYKYRALAGFYIWPDVCRMAMESTRALLRAHGADREVADLDQLWDDFHRYVEHKHTHGATREALLDPTVTVLQHDIPAWLAAGMPRDAASFRLPAPRPFRFELAPDAADELDRLIQVYTTSVRGLTKGVTRMRSTSLIRRCTPVDDAGIRTSATTAALA